MSDDQGRWRHKPALPPIDLRLVPLALAVWAAAVAVTGAANRAEQLTAGAGLVLAAQASVCAAAAAALAAISWVGAAGPPAGAAGTSAAVVATAIRRRRLVRSMAGHLTVVLIGVLAVTAVIVAGQYRLAASGLRDLAGSSGQATLHLTFTGEPALYGNGSRSVYGADVRITGMARSPDAPVQAVSVPAWAWVDTEAGTAPASGGDHLAVADLTWNQQITATATVRIDADGITVTIRQILRAEAPPVFSAWSSRIRTALTAACAGLTAQGRGLVPGMSVGDTDLLEPELAAAMKSAGLTHLTAVSGGHFAIVAALLWQGLGIVRPPPWLRAGAMAALFIALVILVRPEPSVVRAAVMASAGLIGVLLGRPGQAGAALAATVIVVCLVEPALASRLGFILSVAATAGLVAGARPIAERLPWLPAPLRVPVAVATAAQVACAPIIVLIDPRVSLVAVPANVLAAPAVPGATIAGLAAALFAVPAPGVAEWCARGASLFTGWIALVARWSERVPFATVPWPAGGGGLVALGGLTAAVIVLIATWRDLSWYARWYLRSVIAPITKP